MAHPYKDIKEVVALLGKTSFYLDTRPPEGILRAASVPFVGRSPLYIYQIPDTRAVFIDCPSERDLAEVMERFAAWGPRRDGRTIEIPDPYSLQALLNPLKKGA